jgi:SAM-dependent methyltransferase
MSDEIRRITNRLAADHITGDDPTGWFEPLYAAAAERDAAPPWDRDRPRGLLEHWAEERHLDGDAGRRSAIVVGCGLGADAEFIASKNYDTTAFDLSPTAIRLALERHPDTRVRYEVADLLALPSTWRRGFDLVVECWTAQALPDPPRAQAIGAIADLVGPGGTLIAVAIGRPDDGPDDPSAGPPWPLSPATIAQFAHDGVQPVQLDLVDEPEAPGQRLGWRAEFQRPGHG